MWTNKQFSAALVTFTEDILNGKLHFFVQTLHKKMKFSIKVMFISDDKPTEIVAVRINSIS